jgi:hypothetical protein
MRSRKFFSSIAYIAGYHLIFMLDEKCIVAGRKNEEVEAGTMARLAVRPCYRLVMGRSLYFAECRLGGVKTA